METNRAAENLQTIRTLMERSAIYRRALAPILLLAGTVGSVTAAVGLYGDIGIWSPDFYFLWLGAAALAVGGAFLLARRQAFKDKEAFWSGPTKSVTQALSLPFLTGLYFGVRAIWFGLEEKHGGLSEFVVVIWIMCYGFALFTAGFFMPRAIKAFGALFVVCGCGLFCRLLENKTRQQLEPHFLMGFFFGVLHLALGAYLYLTEKKNSAA